MPFLPGRLTPVSLALSYLKNCMSGVETVSPVRSMRITLTASSSRPTGFSGWMFSFGRVERSPGPMPSTARPSEISLSVAANEAIAAGVSVNAFMIPGPILIVLVSFAIAARVG